jgi:hypothetical protein
VSCALRVASASSIERSPDVAGAVMCAGVHDRSVRRLLAWLFTLSAWEYRLLPTAAFAIRARPSLSISVSQQQPPTQVFVQQRRSGCGTLLVALLVLAIITAIVILLAAFGLLGWIFS